MISTNKLINNVFADLVNNRFLMEKSFKRESFIFSIWPFYFSKKKLFSLRQDGIHEYTNHPGKIILDSGGFQILTRKNIAIHPKQTLKIYKFANLEKKDFAITLDFCPRPSEDPRIRMEKIKHTNSNFYYMYSRNSKVIHVIHGWNEKELRESLKPIINLMDSKTESIFCTPLYVAMIPKNMKGDKKNSLKELIIKRFLIFQKLLRESKLDGFKIHILGASSSNSSHAMWYAGMDQTDSAAWRIKAAFGKISLPGISEIWITRKKNWQNNLDLKLKECECPICIGLSLNERKIILGQSFKARAIHNAFVYLEEREIARELIGTKKYLPYLKKRFKTGFWKKFLRKIEESRHQKDLDFFLKNKY